MSTCSRCQRVQSDNKCGIQWKTCSLGYCTHFVSQALYKGGALM